MSLDGINDFLCPKLAFCFVHVARDPGHAVELSGLGSVDVTSHILFVWVVRVISKSNIVNIVC